MSEKATVFPYKALTNFFTEESHVFSELYEMDP
jgi:hypothetical protein